MADRTDVLPDRADIVFTDYAVPHCSQLRVCVKRNIGSDSVLNNRTVQKSDIHSDGFQTETACSPQFKLKVTNNNCTCIQCADKERFTTRPGDTQCHSYSLLLQYQNVVRTVHSAYQQQCNICSKLTIQLLHK